MGSGHTGRGGRGGANRRARRGMQRPGGPQGQSGPAPTTSTISSSTAAPAPAPPEARPSETPLAAHPHEPPAPRDGSAQHRPADGNSKATGEHGAERWERQERRGPQLVPSTTPMGPLPPAERRFETRPPNDHRPPFQQAPHPAEPHAHDAGGTGGVNLGNGSAPHGMGSRPTAERNGHFVATEHTSHFDDDEGDEAEGDLRELPRRDVRGDVGPLIDSLRAVFEHDRSVASQGSNARCGICYLHYPLGDLEYRAEEGYYVCATCAQRIGSARLPMIRRQQR